MNSSMMVDTLNIFERLKRAELPEPAAREISEIFREHFIKQEKVLATKADLLVMGDQMRGEMSSLEARLRTDMAQIKADVIKWVAGMLVAQAALIAALVKLL